MGHPVFLWGAGMPAFTLAELKEQIDEVRAALKDAQK